MYIKKNLAEGEFNPCLPAGRRAALSKAPAAINHCKAFSFLRQLSQPDEARTQGEFSAENYAWCPKSKRLC